MSITLCQAIFWQSLLFFSISTLIMAYVIVRNKFTFNRLLWFIFASFFVAFLILFLATLTKSPVRNNQCFDSLKSAAIIESEEAISIMLYMLVVFRMMFIYSKIRETNENSSREQCIAKTVRHSYCLSFSAGLLICGAIWIHYCEVKFDWNNMSDEYHD